MNVTVAVSSPAPGKAPVVPGLGLATVGETAQAGQGETEDFAAMMRDLAGAPVVEAEGSKPGKAVGASEGKKSRKDKAKGDSDGPVVVPQPETTAIVTAPVAAPAGAALAVAPPPPANDVAVDEQEAAAPATVTVSNAPKPKSRAMSRTESLQSGPAQSPASGLPDGDLPATGVRETKAPPRADMVVEGPDSTPSPPVSRPADASRPEADPTDSRGGTPAHPQAEPSRARTERQPQEEIVVAPERSTPRPAPQPARPGEATALLAVAGRAERRPASVAEGGTPLPPPSDERPTFPAKGAGAAQASPVAIAAVQTSPAATRPSGVPPKAAPEQPDTRADRPPEERAATPAGRGDAPVVPGQTVAQQPLSAPSPVAGSAPAPAALSGTLGQQVVDMGVSGQWIDDIARQIATVAANPGHGSFRIASEALGGVRVDLTPGRNGSDVLMTVDSDAARATLVDEKDRLMQDARLASVRLGDVRVERAVTSADAPRSDTSQQQNGGGQGAPAHAQMSMGQGGGQADQHSARPDATLMNQQGGNSPKTPFTKSVLQDSGASEQPAPVRGRSPDRARYA